MSRSADGELVVWKNDYDRKTRTNNYLGLSSESDISFRRTESENCGEDVAHDLLVALGKEREKLRNCVVEEISGTIQGDAFLVRFCNCDSEANAGRKRFEIESRETNKIHSAQEYCN